MATVGTISAVFVMAWMLQSSAQIVTEGNNTSDDVNTTTTIEMAGVFAPPIDIQNNKGQETRAADDNHIGQPGQLGDSTRGDNDNNNDQSGGKGSSFDPKIDTDGNMLHHRSTHCVFQEGCTLAQPQTDSTERIQMNVNSTAPIHVILREDPNTVPASSDQIQDNGRESVKDCGRPTLKNGKTQTPDGTTSGKTGTIACDTGYTLSGDGRIKCEPSGNWRGSSKCVPKDCGRPTVKNGQMQTTGGTTYGKTATITCDNGYTLSGDGTVKCEASGNWRGSSRCVPTDCGSLNIKNGQMQTPDGTTFGKTGTIACDNGFTLSGDGIVKCEAPGSWRVSARCLPKDCGKPTIKNGKSKTPNGTTFGKTATVSCDNGYILSGNGNVKCEASGSWSTSSTCIPKDCGRLTIQNGKAQTPDGTTFGKTGTKTCDKGYTLTGDGIVICDASGNWRGSSRCVPKDCGKPTIENGKTQTPDGTTFGKTATVSCDNGYILSGDGNVKCEASGGWSTSSTCIPKDCGRPTIKNGKTQTPDGTTFGKVGTVSCDNGYTLSGDGAVRCEASGSWSASSTCIPKDCGKPTIKNGKPQTPDGTTFGKTATVSCDNGYILSGDGNVKCEASGSWSVSSTCSPKDCGRLNIKNGKTQTPGGTTFGKTGTIACDNGYTLSGDGNVKCEASGTWSGSPRCVPKDCRPQTITNGQMHAPDGTTYGKTATISCNNGYTLSGSAVVKCSSSGSWDGRASCVPIDCGSPPYVTNSKIVLDSADTHFRSSAQFHCFSGYKPTVSWDGITVTFYKISLVCSADRYWVTTNTGTPIQAEDIKCQDIDDCASNPCENGKCVDQVNGYKCECNKNYIGQNCNIDNGPCKNNPCQNGGTCSYGHKGEVVCTCTEYYENNRCTSFHRHGRRHA